jgi:tRNA(fMet)-specific endonuclease VapC
VIPLDRLILLDTWVLVHLCRDGTVGRAIRRKYQLRERPTTPVISIVTVGEIYAFARRADWAEKKRAVLSELLANLVVMDIRLEPILQGYAEISTWLHEHGRSMGHNDRWIAATARFLDATILTGDRDFDPLHPEFITRELVDPKTIGAESGADGEG